MANGKNMLTKHWPIVALIVIVSVIFVCFLFCFQVNENEYVIITRFGKPVARNTEPGLRFRLPYPIEQVWRHDKRINVYPSGDPANPSRGALEEVYTADKFNVIVTVYLTWTVLEDDKATEENEILRYKNSNESTDTKAKAESNLADIVRSSKEYIFGKHDFGELVNEDPSKIRIAQIEHELAEHVREEAKRLYAIDVRTVGISHLGLPEGTTLKVIARMKAERKRESDRITAEGKAEASKIREEANRKREELLSSARSEATRIRAEGDAEASKSYKAFAEDPELALFLRQLNALKTIFGRKAYLVLDTTTPPFNLLTLETLENLKANRLKTKSVNLEKK